MKVVPIISDPDYRLSDAKERLISLCEDMGIPVEVKRHAWHKNMQEHHEYWTGTVLPIFDTRTNIAGHEIGHWLLASPENRLSNYFMLDKNTCPTYAAELGCLCYVCKEDVMTSLLETGIHRLVKANQNEAPSNLAEIFSESVLENLLKEALNRIHYSFPTNFKDLVLESLSAFKDWQVIGRTNRGSRSEINRANIFVFENSDSNLDISFCTVSTRININEGP